MSATHGGMERRPTERIGRYILCDEIAAGGMASVYLARLVGDVGFARTVAVKRLHGGIAKDPEFVSMFLDEARITGRIRHPNVVPTLDVVSTRGELFVVMEYVHGESLGRLFTTLVADAASVPAPIAVACLVDALHGLHAAHEAKDELGVPLDIVHRDVSPQNILVGVDGVARMLDFGVAKAIGRLAVTRDGAVKGKLAYMAPEQLYGGELSRLADIYAAAVCLWEMLAGRRLFFGRSEGETVNNVLSGEVAPPSKHNPTVSPALDGMVMRGLARDQTARWQTAKEFAFALEREAPRASASEVGAWVTAIAGIDLAERATMVAAMESVGTDGPATSDQLMQNMSVAEGLIELGVPSDAPPRPPPGSGLPGSAKDASLGPPAQSASGEDDAGPSRRRSLLGAVGAGVLFASVALVLLATSRPRTQVPATAAPTTAPSNPPPAAAAAPPVSAEEAVLTVPAPSTTAPIPPGSKTAKRAPPDPQETPAPPVKRHPKTKEELLRDRD